MIAALRKAGVHVVEYHAAVWDGHRESWRAGPAAALRLARAETRLLRGRAPAVDAFIVGYPGHLDVPAARRAAHGRPIVFNPLVSLADTLVGDRGRFAPNSVAARALERADRWAFDAADIVVADTAAHAAYFRTLTRTRIDVCFVGAEERIFAPDWSRRDEFRAVFVGKLIPLHGIDVVLEAARRAPEIPFTIVGTGQLEPLLRHRPPNVEHVPWIRYEELPAALHAAGCALGVFGTSAKAQRVIPNKAYQALACGTPLVTADTPAARELLTDGSDAILVPPGNADALAAAVRRIAGDAALAARLSAAGRGTYELRASEAVLGARWRELVESVVRAS